MPLPSQLPFSAFWTIGNSFGRCVARLMIALPRASGNSVMWWSGPVIDSQPGTTQSRSSTWRRSEAVLLSAQGAWKAMASGALPTAGVPLHSLSARLSARSIERVEWRMNVSGCVVPCILGRSLANGSSGGVATARIDPASTPAASRTSSTKAIVATAKRRRRRPEIS